MSGWTQEDLDKCYFLEDDEYDRLQYMIATDEEKAYIDQKQDEAFKTGAVMIGGLAGMFSKSTLLQKKYNVGIIYM